MLWESTKETAPLKSPASVGALYTYLGTMYFRACDNNEALIMQGLAEQVLSEQAYGVIAHGTPFIGCEHLGRNELAKAIGISETDARSIEECAYRQVVYGLKTEDTGPYSMNLLDMDLLEFLERTELGRKRGRTNQWAWRTFYHLYEHKIIEASPEEDISTSKAVVRLVEDLYRLTDNYITVYANGCHIPFGEKSLEVLTETLREQNLPELCSDRFTRRES